MDSFWCAKKNSIVNWINNGVAFSPALIPCKRSECEKGKNGECIHLPKFEINVIEFSWDTLLPFTCYYDSVGERVVKDIYFSKQFSIIYIYKK